MTEDTAAEPVKPPQTKKSQPPQFLPKLLGKKVTLRMMGGGMPMTGVLEAFNAYEIKLTVNKKCFIVYKHAIATIEVAG